MSRSPELEVEECPRANAVRASIGMRAAGPPAVRLVLLLAIALLATRGALAQNAPNSNAGNAVGQVALQEVVVTATKEGAHPVDDVPMAIQAFTAESLVSKGVRQTLDLIELIPGASEQSEIGAGYRI